MRWLVGFVALTAFCCRGASLPDTEPYQRTLRQYLATLTEKDFEHGVTNTLDCLPGSSDAEYQYRNHIYNLTPQPLIGSKRALPAINAPASLFTLTAIEGSNAVLRLPVYPETLASFLQWDYPGNPYHNNRALKLRVFVAAAVNLMMFDDYLGRTPTARRADWSGYQLVCAAASYLGCRDELPAEPRQAFEAGLKRLAHRLIEWGPRGEEPHMDLTVPLGLWYAARACGDTELNKAAEDYARRLLVDPRYFHPAGYYVERGGLDMGFAGMANWFATGLALASDWPFATVAVAKVYRLRAHLVLPEPDGKLTGPSHFNSRLGTPACNDQWDYANREHGAAMLTDEAACFVKMPTTGELAKAAAEHAGEFNRQIRENPRAGKTGFLANDQIKNAPWVFRLWPSWDFPASINFAYEFYRADTLARRRELEAASSPALRSPYLCEGTFVTNFANAFVVAKRPTYSAILHTGPVGRQDPKDGLAQFAGPLGFGGGQLSAFWTPTTGSVILGRRDGMSWDKNFDTPDAWQRWPIHAVSGCTTSGAIVTSARIVEPVVHCDSNTVSVTGTITTVSLTNAVEYERTFVMGDAGVRVETQVKYGGRESWRELYETIPVFLRDMKLNPAVSVQIEFQIAGSWLPATADNTEKVQAVRVKRYAGMIEIRFDVPQSVRLADQEWRESFIGRAVCRNVLVDWLADNDNRRVAYTIRAVQP